MYSRSKYSIFMVTYIIIVALSLSAYAADGKNHFPYGMPGNIPPSGVIIHRNIYTLCNNGQTKFADWVAYAVDPKTMEKIGNTKRNWKQDPDLPAKDTLVPADYKGANKALKTDRGHQVPLASFQGTNDWAQTNYLSNITPQKSALNQGPWKNVEDAVRRLAANNTVYVITGPLYEREMPMLPGTTKEHRIPSGYWKIIAVKHANKTHPLDVIGFIFDQETPRKAKELGYTATVDQIEARTGLDFYPDLSDTIEAEVERCNSLRLGLQ